MHVMATTHQSVFGDMNVTVPLYQQRYDSNMNISPALNFLIVPTVAFSFPCKVGS